MTTAEKIKYHRERLGLSTSALGEMIGVQSSAISKYEKGRVVNIKRTTLMKMAKVFGVTPMELFDDVDELADEYYKSVDELELHEDLQRVLSRVTDHKYTDEELEQILSYARFIGSK